MNNDAWREDPTLNPDLRSWVQSANEPTSDFPIQNLPLCTFIHPSEQYAALGVRIGEGVVDLVLLAESGILEHEHGAPDDFFHALEDPGVNGLAALGRPAWINLRRQVQEFLIDGAPSGGQRARRVREKAVLDARGVEFLTPSVVGNYTDFYASIDHATTVGSMFRPDNPLLPNYKWVPIGYHGRASSVVPSGTPIRRPSGQLKADDVAGQAPSAPNFAPCKMLDYELEMGVIIGAGNELGVPIPVDHAEDHILGLSLVNDWSARDIQKWEYQPLGPFLAKNFATTIGTCVVTLEALAPFRCEASARPTGDPAPLPYLAGGRANLTFDITLEVRLTSRTMRDGGMAGVVLSRSNAFSRMYWTFAQMLAHHTSNGCNLMPGDLIASGTISGTDEDSRGCLLERTWQGRGADGAPKPRKAVELPTGEKRLFLEDGDEVSIRGWCERQGARRIGLGECVGRIGS